MAILQTTKCGGYQHPEFRISCDANRTVECDASWLIDWLEQAVAGGERFVDGQTCQIGWMVLQIRSQGDGCLALWEPDMKQFPVVWTETVGCTLAQFRLQKDVCESVLSSSDVLFPSMLQSAIICNRLGQTHGIVMERCAPSGADSGWFFGCRNGNHNHNSVSELHRVSLYEAAVRYARQIIPFLALPEGVLLEVGEESPAIFRNSELLEFKQGSYLAAYYGSH